MILAAVPPVAVAMIIGSWVAGGSLTLLIIGLYAAPIGALLGVLFAIGSMLRKEPGSARPALIVNVIWLLVMAGVVYFVLTNPIDFR